MQATLLARPQAQRPQSLLPLDAAAAGIACITRQTWSYTSPAEAYQRLAEARFTGAACLEAAGAKLTLLLIDGVALGAHLETRTGIELYGEAALDAFEETGAPIKAHLIAMSPEELLTITTDEQLQP